MSGLLPSAPKMPKPPSAPPVMPDPLDPGAMEARRKRIAAEIGRSGRQSTILSGSGNPGGGGGSRTTLGAG